jgi:hypothetical protein
MKLSTTIDVIDYANSVHMALHGESLPFEAEANCSDHIYGGYSVTTISELVDGDLVKKQVREHTKNLKTEVEAMYSNFAIGTPIKVTKGSKDKRGIEGFIIHASDPHQGSGKALFVYDVLTSRSCFVRDSATKVRLPKPGERDALKDTYKTCELLVPRFTTGTKVYLKSDRFQTGFVIKAPHLDHNLEGNGFYQVGVMWNGTSKTSTNILTELEIL